MTAADVALTHTMPLLGALAVVPLAPGLEMSIAKTYLLFQASAPGICVTGATDVAGVTGVADVAARGLGGARQARLAREEGRAPKRAAAGSVAEGQRPEPA